MNLRYVLAILIAVPGLVGSVAAQAPCGDCNVDGTVTILDAFEGAQDAVLLIQLQGEAFRRCDVDQSGAIDVLDVLVIAQSSVGLTLWLDCVPELPHELCVYTMGFTGGPGYPWPQPWTVAGGVDLADLQMGAARLRPTITTYSLARMAMPAAETDVDLTFTVEFEDPSTSGCGFYVRQNGGHLTTTVPNGQGYAVFVEGFRGDGIGIWKEENGIETDLQILFDPSLGLAPGVRFRVRFRVDQESPTTTRLRCKMWPESTLEPIAWHVDITDTTPVLQGISGGFAVDAWSTFTPPAMGPTASVMVDDIKIVRLVDPLQGIGPVTVVAGGFSFLEGPHWRQATNQLYFVDVSTSTVHSLTPPSSVGVVRSSSGGASGLATDVNGDLLACEWGGHRVSRMDGLGLVTTVAMQYMGMTLHSPNDLDVRSDGTIYFTDPPFGTAPSPPLLPFNGLFRITPVGVLEVEWMGGGGTRPNGVILSPDERTLYLADWALGTITTWDVATDGTLSNPQLFASGVGSADGMAVDILGNLYVASSGGVRVWTPAADPLGTIASGGSSNCAFGGVDGLTLYITTGGTLRSVDMVVPGHF